MKFGRYTLMALLLAFATVSPTMAHAQGQAEEATADLTPVFLAFILALSIFLGFELISKVPATLHTPLMSG